MINKSQIARFNPQPWDWNTYFRYLSYQGLEESDGFKALFPIGSGARFVYNQYIANGHANL